MTRPRSRRPDEGEPETRPPTSMRLDAGLLAEVRERHEGPLSALVDGLLRQWVKQARTRQGEAAKQKEVLYARLAAAQTEWREIELRRAKAAGDKEAIQHYEQLLRGA